MLDWTKLHYYFFLHKYLTNKLVFYSKPLWWWIECNTHFDISCNALILYHLLVTFSSVEHCYNTALFCSQGWSIKEHYTLSVWEQMSKRQSDSKVKSCISAKWAEYYIGENGGKNPSCLLDSRTCWQMRIKWKRGMTLPKMFSGPLLSIKVAASHYGDAHIVHQHFTWLNMSAVTDTGQREGLWNIQIEPLQ